MNERSYLIKLIGNTVYSSKINTISYIIINVILTLLLVATTVLCNSLSALMTNTINNKIDCRTIFAKGYDESISRDILLESIKSANKHISTAAFQDYAFSVGEILEIKHPKEMVKYIFTAVMILQCLSFQGELMYFPIITV